MSFYHPLTVRVIKPNINQSDGDVRLNPCPETNPMPTTTAAAKPKCRILFDATRPRRPSQAAPEAFGRGIITPPAPEPPRPADDGGLSTRRHGPSAADVEYYRTYILPDWEAGRNDWF